MDKNIDNIIALLQQGKQLPEEYQELLFPVNHAEYELTYKGKLPKEKILSIGEEPQGVPFQIEKIFGEKSGTDQWQNLLMFGDNFQVLKTLHENKDPLIRNKVKGKVKLIYIDPPFATQDEFQNKDGAKAYNDKVKGAEFIEFIRQRLILAREVLANDGSIYVHLDGKMVHYIKVIMDEIFGKNGFRNAIIWHYGGRMMHNVSQYNRKYDMILFYTKSASEYFFSLPKDNVDFEKYAKSRHEKIHIDENGDRYLLAPDATMERTTRQYEDEIVERGRAIDDVWDIRYIRGNAKERTGYPTQKPEELLDRIIEASTNEGDLVMDFFAGSGTTLAVAERLNRRWVGVDIGKLAIYTIQKRLLTLPNRKPFALVNAGCYDLKKIFEMEKQKYLDFVCELFHVEKQSKRINGISVDGKRRGDWVKIYEWQDFNKTHTAVDEAFVEELHRNIGDKISDKFYIIAPEMNVDINIK